mmetsp:Transcript_2531/g.3879  ORF Transcript_2531/g.3879 Transcript_2531/m.3879 type:complete len:209 (-) Transcript_2531:1028-1654(-)
MLPISMTDLDEVRPASAVLLDVRSMMTALGADGADSCSKFGPTTMFSVLARRTCPGQLPLAEALRCMDVEEVREANRRTYIGALYLARLVLLSPASYSEFNSLRSSSEPPIPMAIAATTFTSAGVMLSAAATASASPWKYSLANTSAADGRIKGSLSSSRFSSDRAGDGSSASPLGHDWSPSYGVQSTGASEQRKSASSSAYLWGKGS